MTAYGDVEGNQTPEMREVGIASWDALLLQLMNTAIPDSHADLLEWDAKTFAHVATIGPDGAPQNNPVWFDWDGEHLKFSLTTGRQKYRNLNRDARVSLSILDPDNPYRYLEVRGELAGIDPDPDIEFISRMAKKYIDEDRYPWHRAGDERVVMKVKPVKTTAMG